MESSPKRDGRRPSSAPRGRPAPARGSALPDQVPFTLGDKAPVHDVAAGPTAEVAADRCSLRGATRNQVDPRADTRDVIVIDLDVARPLLARIAVALDLVGRIVDHAESLEHLAPRPVDAARENGRCRPPDHPVSELRVDHERCRSEAEPIEPVEGPDAPTGVRIDRDPACGAVAP